MLSKRLFSSLACAALLSACATPPPAPPPLKPAPAPTLAAYLGAAETSLKAAKPEEAIGWLKRAIAAYPADKAPRLRLAQVQFECLNYGEAISRAQEVLAQDPEDLTAHSLVAVSGLRVSSKALGDLAMKNRLSGSVRTEAQDLTRILRANIGGEIIPAPKPPRHPARAPTVKPEIASVPTPAGGSLKDWLNN